MTAPPAWRASDADSAAGSAKVTSPRRSPQLPVGALQPGREQVHRRIAEEAGDEGVGRTAIDLERAADLHDLALVHDADPVAHGHRLDLVMGDVDGGRAELLLLPDQLVAGADAERGVEVRERLVEEEDLGVADDRAPEGDALPLAARERVRLAAKEGREAELARGLADPAIDLVPRHAAPPQAERQVRLHVHVRVERIGLEDHGDVTILGRHVIDDLAVDRDGAGADRLEAGDHPAESRTCRSRTARAGP